LVVKKCLHCGLPVGNKDDDFCCNGCKTVYKLINSTGLNQFYKIKNETIAPPAELRPDSFLWLDNMLDDNRENIIQLKFDVQGIHCAACVWLLQKLFNRFDGALNLRINPALGRADITWDSSKGDIREYFSEIEQFGYRFGPQRKTHTQSDSLQLRMGICIAIAINTMMFSLSFYFGLTPLEGGTYSLFSNLSLILASVSLLLGGWPFISAAVVSLRRKIIHLDVPIALGMIFGYSGSVYAFLTDGIEAAYFDTVTIFIALMLVGRWLQESVLKKNRNAILASDGIGDLFARRYNEAKIIAVPASEIKKGDRLWIAPGDLVPVIGALQDNQATFSLDWITGESDSKQYQPNDEVPAGAFNSSSSGACIIAAEDFSSSNLNNLMRSVEMEAPEGQLWWHKVSSIYVITVLVLAVFGFFFWIGKDANKAVEVSVAILIVTCPCALGIAVPLAKELVHNGLRNNGILLRNDDFLDRALTVTKVIFDKTGTLTAGKLELTSESTRILRKQTVETLSILQAMTSRSNHPVSKCVTTELSQIELPVIGLDANFVVEIAGQGLQLDKYRFEKDEKQGTVFKKDGIELFRVETGEKIRQDAVNEVTALNVAGYEVYLLSGDNKNRVIDVASKLEIKSENAFYGMTPENKIKIIANLDKKDTIMIGDGLNDSLGFDAAWCTATPAIDSAVLPQKADFYYLGDGVGAVRKALTASHALSKVQKMNLAFAAGYNAIAVGICLAGWVNPIVAAILMPLSSLSIVSLTTIKLSRRNQNWMS
jgi:P-type Cu2+ transporter